MPINPLAKTAGAAVVGLSTFFLPDTGRNAQAQQPHIPANKSAQQSSSNQLIDLLERLLPPLKLTAEEHKAIDTIESFLKNHTNGRLDHGTIPRLVAALEYDALSQQLQEERSIIKRRAIRRYLGGKIQLPGVPSKIQREYRYEASPKLAEGLDALGIDRKTANNIDCSSPEHPLTMAELDGQRNAWDLLDKATIVHLRKFFPGEDRTFIFPGGIDFETIRHMRLGKRPPGAVMVKVSELKR